MFHQHLSNVASEKNIGFSTAFHKKRCVTENTQRLFDKYAEPIDEAPKSSLQLSTFASHDSFVVAWRIGGSHHHFWARVLLWKLIRTKVKDDSKKAKMFHFEGSLENKTILNDIIKNVLLINLPQ